MKLRARLFIGFGLACVAAAIAAPDPAALAQRLADPSSRRRDEAASELLALGTAAAPALTDAAASADPEVRTRARALLVLVTDGDGAGTSVRLRTAEVAVRDALRAAGGLDPGSSSDERIAVLMPESGRVLAAAARRIAERGFVSRSMACALARHATAESLAVLAESVRDERLFPSAGLGAARELETAFAADRSRAQSVRSAAARAVVALGAAMTADHAPTRRMAVALYGVLAGDACAAAVTARLEDADAAVRAEACRVLGLYAPGETASALRNAAVDPCAGVRAAALTALLDVPGVPHPEPALGAADDASAAVREAAARLLARDALPDSFGAVSSLACDPSVRVRIAARAALAALRR